MSVASPAAAQRTGKPRPVGRRAGAVGAMLARSWSLPPRRNKVTIDPQLAVPMSDGTILLADHYIPVTGQPAATVLVRCPYGRGAPFSMSMAQLIAERGYHVLMQSVRGTFGSGGTFEPMRNEASDGQDTVAWLRQQSWFDGRLATYGGSYLGFVQWALATDPPPELVAAVVQVGPHDMSTAVYRGGVFDLYNYAQWTELVANQERYGSLRGMYRSATADRRLAPVLDRMPFGASVRSLLGAGAPWFESWLENPPADPFWEPLRCGAALERITVPTLLVGGWHDLFLHQTLAQYQVLNGRGVPVRLLVGPWTHLDTARSGLVTKESLEWLDRCTGTGPEPVSSVRVYVGGAGEWRDLPDWPPPGGVQQRWYLGAGGTLGVAQPDDAGSEAGFRYDPASPTPTVGGATMVPAAGARDNKAVEERSDVLVFTSAPLDQAVEVIGAVRAELSATRDNPNADLFARLCDVDPRGKSVNVGDGIIRLNGSPLAGLVRVSLSGVAHRFEPGHRIRLQVAGGAHPRFARNPGNGQPDAPPAEFVPTNFRISTAGESALMLDVNGVS
jgi:putative CocE/NonD family hydrolase